MHPTALELQERLATQRLGDGIRPAHRDEVRTATGSAMCAAGTPNAVFCVRTEELIGAIRDPEPTVP